jgi:hypothetical protein
VLDGEGIIGDGGEFRGKILGCCFVWDVGKDLCGAEVGGAGGGGAAKGGAGGAGGGICEAPLIKFEIFGVVIGSG